MIKSLKRYTEAARQRTELTLPLMSLMQPTAPTEAIIGDTPLAFTPVQRKYTQWEDDLGISELVDALTTDRRYAPFVRQTLGALISDTQIIAWRQAVLADFLANPALVEAINTLLPQISSLRYGSAQLGQHRRSLLLETSDRLAELDLYLQMAETLYTALQAAQLHSEALITLRANLAALIADTTFATLRDELPTLRAPLENIKSLTIGVNLNHQMQPESAVLIAVNGHKLGEPVGLLDRLIGTRQNPETEESGLAALHPVNADRELRMFDPLFQDLDRLMVATAQPIARALTRYVRVSTKPLLMLEFDLAFYSCAAALIRRLEQRGIHFCRPQIAPRETRQADVVGLMNMSLALRSTAQPVASPMQFDDTGRIAVLTGPNSGGKTTYVQSVGLAHILFQAGLWLPAKSATLSPVDQILTHFPALETQQQGRLAEEAERLRDVLQRATVHSLVLLNETFSSTSAGEAQYLAQDVLSALCAIGVRAVFATHLTELADHFSEIEAYVSTPKSTLYSLVAGIHLTDDGHVSATYAIQRGKPLGRSYAQEIARRYGISFDQIMAAQGLKDK